MHPHPLRWDNGSMLNNYRKKIKYRGARKKLKEGEKEKEQEGDEEEEEDKRKQKKERS